MKLVVENNQGVSTMTFFILATQIGSLYWLISQLTNVSGKYVDSGFIF